MEDVSRISRSEAGWWDADDGHAVGDLHLLLHPGQIVWLTLSFIAGRHATELHRTVIQPLGVTWKQKRALWWRTNTNGGRKKITLAPKYSWSVSESFSISPQEICGGSQPLQTEVSQLVLDLYAASGFLVVSTSLLCHCLVCRWLFNDNNSGSVSKYYETGWCLKY